MSKKTKPKIAMPLKTKPAGKKTAFVLAGGGSLGAVEVGMLEALVAHGTIPDLVVGSSVGAINGAHFSGDPTPRGVEGLAEIWRGLRRSDVFPISPLGGMLGLLWQRNHLVDPKRLRRLIETSLPYRNLEDAVIPMHVVAADILSGQEVIVSSGPAADAVLASAAIPAVFPPVELGGQYLSDGGVASNTPISAAIELGADRVVVLPTGFSCSLTAPPSNAMSMALHGLGLLISRQLVVDVEHFQNTVKLHIVPPLCPVDTLPSDFSRSGHLIEHAAESTRQWLDGGGLGRTEIPPHMRAHSHR